MPHTVLRAVLNNGRFGDIRNHLAILKESGRDAELKLIKIDNVPHNAVLLSLDGVDTQTLFKGGNGQNKRCDYLLITGDILYFIEMKTSSRAPEKYYDECIQKFNAIECITDYIDSVLVKFYGKVKIFNPLLKCYTLLYKATPIDKQLTSQKPKAEPMNNTPEMMLTLPVENNSTIDINELSN